MNNNLVTIGQYYGTLTWNNHTLSNTGQNYNGYMLKVNAATGSPEQLTDFTASTSCLPVGTALDKNGNVYVSGQFRGTMNFASGVLSSTPAGQASHFLLKYKNVNCGCNLLQPAFNINPAGTYTYHFTYTGGSPYSAISWNFGDGTPSVSGANPSHTYNSLGIFPVCVTVTNTCGSNTTCRYVTVSATKIEDTDNVFGFVSIYPNPAKEQILISNLP